MDKPIYKMMKVFDSQWDPGMPEDVKDAFFDCYRDSSVGNDSYVEWTIQKDGCTSDSKSEWEGKEKLIKNHKLVDDWLISNGAESRNESSLYNGETVLIKHWW